jgi:ProP effector
MSTTSASNTKPRRPILRLVTPAVTPEPAAPKLAASRDARWRWTPPASSSPAKPAPQPSPQPAEVPRAAPRRRAPRAAKPTPYDVLRDRFPVFRAWLPLKIGIRDDLAAAAPDLRADVLLCRHTRTLAYLRAVAAGGPRYDLDAQPAGSVSPDEQAYAAMQLARLRGDKQCRAN